jgi:Ras-related protein Rab-28
MRAVKQEKHNKFVKDKDIQSFNISAKTGDSVNLMFQQVAANILGVTLSRIQVEDTHRVVKADIVKFKEQKAPVIQEKKSSVCILQ